MRYQVRAMSVGEILGGSFRLLVEHAALLVPIAALVYLPLAAIPSLLMDDPTVVGFEAALAIWLATSLAAPVVSGAITFAVGEAQRSRPVTVAAALQLGLSLLPRLAGTWLLGSLAILAGFVLLVLPGIYLALAFMVATQVIVFEGIGGTLALARSRALMRGNLGRGLLIAVVALVVTTLLTSVAELLFHDAGALRALGLGLAQAIGMAWFSAVLVLLYGDVRARHESPEAQPATSAGERATGAPTVASPV